MADGFEQVEMTEPRKALEEAGARTEIVSPAQKEVQGWKHHEKADKFPVDVELDAAHPENYDALLLPGGVINRDQLRVNPKAVEFVKSFFQEGRPDDIPAFNRKMIEAFADGAPVPQAVGPREHGKSSR